MRCFRAEGWWGSARWSDRWHAPRREVDELDGLRRGEMAVVQNAAEGWAAGEQGGGCADVSSGPPPGFD